MDEILNEDFSDWERKIPYNFASHDKEGRPAMVSGFGQLDLRRLVLAGQKDQLDRYLIYGFERGLYNVHNVGNLTGKVYIDGYMLFDMAGYSTKAHACLACIPSWVSLVSNYERYYPRLVTNVILINTPRVFQTLLNTLRPLITPHTAKNLRVYGLDKDEWKRELLKTFPEDQLLIAFGGTLKL